MGAKKNRCNAELLHRLHQQADYLLLTRDWATAPDLSALLHELKLARFDARRIVFRGVTFPLAWSIISTVVCCPKTGRHLVGKLVV